MNYYNLLFKGVEINRKPLDLDADEYANLIGKFIDTPFELKLNPNSKEIKWFTNLPIEVAAEICEKNNINPSSVSIGNMVFLYKQFFGK
jgi:hypothetical protein